MTEAELVRMQRTTYEPESEAALVWIDTNPKTITGIRIAVSFMSLSAFELGDVFPDGSMSSTVHTGVS